MPALLRPALSALGVACLLSAASLASSGTALAQAKQQPAPAQQAAPAQAQAADSDRCRPGFRDDLAHHSDLKSPTRSEMMSPTIPG